MFNWFLQTKKEQPQFKFTPKIVISPKSTLYIEVQPKDPTTTSNIAVTAFASAQVRSIIPVRVEWSRFKVKSDNKHSSQKIHCLVGNTYMCEPGDVGGYIQAVIRSVDETVRAEAQVTIGPIGIDTMIKRIIEGALYSGSLLSQVILHQKDKNCNINLRLSARTMEFTDQANHQPLVKEYTISEPKVQLNPKDPTRVYLRFQQDQNNSVRQWLNTILNLNNPGIEESSLSLKVPYSVHSSSSSKMRLFQKSHGPCVNKMQLKFISRHSRDLFLFTQRAFVCKQDMKNSAILHKIQTLQNIVTEQDYFKFLSFMSLKFQIFRISDYAKEIQDDRNAKVKDLQAMEQSIGEMTFTYLKIIEETGKKQKIDFEQSYSQISNTRQEIMNRKNIRELKAENQNLKQRLRQMNEQIQLLKFFKKDDNQSMIFNQTSNPFAKKGPGHDQSVSQGNSPQASKSHRSNMYQMSINYANLLEENRQLKQQIKSNKKNQKQLDRSQNMIELLGSLDERQQKQIKYAENQRLVTKLKAENQELKKKITELLSEQNSRTKGIHFTTSNRSLLFQQSHLNNSLLNQSNFSAVGESYLNQSITSEAAFMKLEENLRSLNALNVRLQEDNTRIRRQRQHYRSELMKCFDYIKQLENKRNERINPDDSMIIRYKQENQNLQNERNGLLRKLQSLSRQNPQGIKQEFLQRQRKIKQLQQQLQSYRIQIIRLKNSQFSPTKKDQSDIISNQNTKLKKINSQLLQEIKNLKIQLENRCGDNMYNSRVIQLQNELNYIKNSGELSCNSGQTNIFLQQINQLTKINAKLVQQNQDQKAKLEHQTLTIQKLMAESINSGSPKNPSLTSTGSKQKCYSQRASQPTVEQIQKYKRQIKNLQQQILIMKRSTDVLNRSRDLSMEMDGIQKQKLDLKNRQIEKLLFQLQNISKVCERFKKETQKATVQCQKWKNKYYEVIKLRTDQNSLISNQ